MQLLLVRGQIILTFSAARSQNWPVHRCYRESSGVEEHRLPIALKKDVESVDDCTVSLGPGRYQRSAPLRLLDNVQDRILGICRFFVIKIHARGQADIDAARGQPKIYMRRHGLTAFAADYASRLDGANCIEPRVEVGACPCPAAEALIE